MVGILVALVAFFARDIASAVKADHKIARVGVVLVGSTICLYALRFSHQSSEWRVFWAQVLLLGVAMPFVAMAGAGMGLWVGLGALWYAVPAVLLYLPDAVEDLGRRLPPALQVKGRAVRWALVVSGACIFVLSTAVRPLRPYRDMRDPRLVRASVHHPRLRGIRTNARRAESLDALLAELQRRVSPGDSVLAYGHTSLVHYLTETEPALGCPWPICLPPKILEERLAQFGWSRPLPKVAVRALVNTRTREWGHRDVRQRGPRWELDKIAAIDNTLSRLGYRRVWANKQFAILARKDGGRGPDTEPSGRADRGSALGQSGVEVGEHRCHESAASTCSGALREGPARNAQSKDLIG